MVTAVRLPPAPPRTGFCFLEVARRHGDYAQAGVAVRLTLDDGGRCGDARLVFLAVGPGPVACTRAAAALAGQPPTPELFAAAGRIAAEEEVDPTGDMHASVDFKRHLVGVLATRALAVATRRAVEAGS